MGEVFRAHDSRLKREVAIKVLRADAVGSDERRRRFELEARAASALNHPNILTVHDIGEEGGVAYIVSELLDGETLRAVVAKGALAVRAMLEIAVQTADGLAAAHGAGILHRDLKPENLFVLADGRVKILDFGLAKELIGAGQDDRTRTGSELLTSPGTVVGTIAYMSPEQIEGRALSFRSDQFSFGTILYEMATGKRPFRGEDQAATMAAIVKDEPAPVATIQPQVPAPLRWVIERCLAKEPARRYASTSDLHQQLRDLRDHLSELSSHQSVRAEPVTRKRWPMSVAIAGLGALAGFLLAVTRLPPVVQNHPYRYTPFATETADERQPAWSPDGRSIAYVASVDGTGQVFTRALNAHMPAQLTKSTTDCADPFWSADGTRIYYRAQVDLWSVGAAGGAAQVEVRNISTRSGPAAASSEGKTLAFFRTNGVGHALYLRSLSDGKEVSYSKQPFPVNFRFSDGVRFSPDGKKLAAALISKIGPEVSEELWVIPYPDGTPRKVPWKVHPGFRTSALSWADDNRHCLFSTELAFGASPHILQVDTDTGEILPVTSGTGEETHPAVSRDGGRIAFTSGGFEYDLVQIGLDGSKVVPLLATARQEYNADWSPSGKQYLYVSNAGGFAGIWLRSATENWSRQLLEGTDEGDLGRPQPRFSPDGQRIAYVRMTDRHSILIFNLSGGAAIPLENESPDQHSPAWSPDGNWIAYTRYVGQKMEIAKAPSGGGGQPERISQGGDPGSWLEWSSTGKWICDHQPTAVYLIPAEGGSPRRLHGPANAVAFSKDGTTLYVIRPGKDRRWELASLAVPDGVEKKSVRLELPPETAIRYISLHPDGAGFAVTIGTPKRDIWILDGFKPPAGRLRSWIGPS